MLWMVTLKMVSYERIISFIQLIVEVAKGQVGRCCCSWEEGRLASVVTPAPNPWNLKPSLDQGILGGEEPLKTVFHLSSKRYPSYIPHLPPITPGSSINNLAKFPTEQPLSARAPPQRHILPQENYRRTRRPPRCILDNVRYLN